MKNILIFEWGSYTHKDILEAFGKGGFTCRVMKYRFSDVNHDDTFVQEFNKYLEEGSYEFVYSTNFFPLVARCCHEHSLKYISWSYDAPLDVPDIEKTLGLSCNYAFMYDIEQVNGYKNAGFDNVYHLPLAVNTKRLDRILLSAADRRKYGAQVSFVGNLYGSEMLNIRSALSEFHRGFIDAVMKAQSKIYGYYLVDDVLTDELVDDMKKQIPILNKPALSYAMAAQITREERLLALKLLSNHYEVKLYSREQNELLDKVSYMGTVDYDTEMPKVFKESRINLNMTLRCIKSGIPLRALDIMGAGGFLLSNYQPELAQAFEDGVEMVMYESIEDMYEKAGYYLANPELSEDIALRGHDKVLREYGYDDRIKTMLQIAGLD